MCYADGMNYTVSLDGHIVAEAPSPTVARQIARDYAKDHPGSVVKVKKES